jgi:predicted RNA-binding protein with PUA-like domain
MSNYWLMKSEPYVYSIDDLRKDGSTHWEGVRNYAARNHMRAMNVGDMVLFYHSQAKPPAVVGLARVSREAYPDHFAWQPGHAYFDEKSTPEEPRWWMVDVEFVEKFPNEVTLPEIKATRGLEEMVLVKRGRLSVQPVTTEEYERIVAMGRG